LADRLDRPQSRVYMRATMIATAHIAFRRRRIAAARARIRA
jgi:hypothetical protein